MIEINRKTFSNYELNCPKNAEEYLERMYGKKWNTKGCT